MTEEKSKKKISGNENLYTMPEDDGNYEPAEDDGNCGPIEITAEVSGQRLDSFIAENTPFSRSAVQKLIDGGFITVNSAFQKSKYHVRTGDIISVSPPPPEPVDVVPQDIPIDILYEDSDIAVVNKPVGMVVHPAAGNPDGTLVNALLFHLKDLSGIGGELRPGIVHRIDKNTSGLLIVAKNDAAHIFLSEKLRLHEVRRIYYALCEGNFKEDSGVVNAPIGRHRTDRKRMAVVSSGGREAVTHWKVMERYGNATLVCCELETGRTHQIRVHMAYIHHPIIGDDVYGSGKNPFGFTGQALHSAELHFTHPRTGENMVFHADPPEIFKNAVEKLRKTVK